MNEKNSPDTKNTSHPQFSEVGKPKLTLKSLALTIKDYLKAAWQFVTAPINKLIHSGKNAWKKSHSQASLKHTTIRKSEPTTLEKKQNNRNYYLTDLDDTIIDWKVASRSKLWKLNHKFIHRPANEPVEIFTGAEEHIRSLNSQGVRTAIVSNKSHEKLVAQAAHNKWDKLFDVIVGHDRDKGFTERKGDKEGMLNDKPSTLPTIAMKKLNEMFGDDNKLKKGMEPVTVIFVGDRYNQDIATARALDTELKKYNPLSSCTGILLNSRNFSQELLDNLPESMRPHHVVNVTRGVDGNDNGNAYKQVQAIAQGIYEEANLQRAQEKAQKEAEEEAKRQAKQKSKPRFSRSSSRSESVEKTKTASHAKVDQSTTTPPPPTKSPAQGKGRSVSF